MTSVDGALILTTDVAKSASVTLVGAGIPEFCFLMASATAIIGMSLGLYMGAIRDHQLMPVHAHLNVIGWLGMFVIGLFYKAHGKTRGKLVTLQVGTMALGYVLMTACLAVLLLQGGNAMFFAAFTGAFMLLAGMIMFLIVVLRAAIKGEKIAIIHDQTGVRNV